MRKRSARSVDWGHLVLLGVIVSVVIAYLFDARATSLKTNNLLLLQPAAIIALVLAAFVLPQILRHDPGEDEGAAEARARLIGLAKVGCLAAAFGIFVFSLETIGFDVGTFVFTATGLWLCGERRIWVIALYSGIFTAAVIYGYQQLVPYPFPLTIL